MFPPTQKHSFFSPIYVYTNQYLIQIHEQIWIRFD